MKPWVRYVLCAAFGVLAGGGGAIWSVRAGALGSNERIGAWTTGRDFGTADASARTRAIVALRGLLALPAHEARYYNAAVDDTGRPLDGTCTYRVQGGALPATWWSLTMYDHVGYLVPNTAHIFSVGSGAIPLAERTGWTVLVSPGRQPGHWLPSGTGTGFELTLRAYLPVDGGTGNLTAAQLPKITREAC